MNSAQLINQTSGNCEYRTPQNIVEAARRAMGGISLDPASSYAFNQHIKAEAFFGLQKNGTFIDGLKEEWHGRIWLNHPFGRGGNQRWIEKLFEEFDANRVEAACCITYACTSENWFQCLLGWPQCFLAPRTNYLLPDGTVKRGVTKGSVVTYLGDQTKAFAMAFAGLGTIKVQPVVSEHR
jgi:hypothetical protein